jgi:hypothetical protein
MTPETADNDTSALAQQAQRPRAQPGVVRVSCAVGLSTMAAPPKFEPRSLIQFPENFGRMEDPEWILARHLPRVLTLSRAREQHELALQVQVLCLAHRNSTPDVADALEQRQETLWNKLTRRLTRRPQIAPTSRAAIATNETS